MQKRLTRFTAGLTLLMLGGCSWLSDNDIRLISFPGVYKIDIQQGNVLTQDMINQLRPGMTREQVSYVMGSPLLPDSYNNDRWDYIYSFQSGKGKGRTQQTLSLFFEDDSLSYFTGDVRPETNDEVTAAAASDATAARDKALQTE